MTDYSRGYSKGYAAGMKRGHRFVDRLLHEGKKQRARAERAEAGQGLGTCQGCRMWERGGAAAKWGYCRLPEEVPAMLPWMGLEARQGHENIITTHKDFGCVRFEPGDTDNA